MIKSLSVNLGKRSYGIAICYNQFREMGRMLRRLDIGDEAVVVTNSFIKSLFGKKLKDSLAEARFSVKFEEIPDSESSKSNKECNVLIEKIVKFGRHRRIFIVAFGGGVVGDLAGYVAAIYKRGIPYVQVPTTLVSQVDSAIGGKVGIDLPSAKNLIGAFYQPRLVFTDLSTLQTLPIRQLKCGLAEVIKYGVIKDFGLFMYLEKNYEKILQLNKSSLEHIVLISSRIKARIVEQDERDVTGKRAILNFGHTIGHALEAATRYSAYNHGEAVAIGMVVACEIAYSLGLIKISDVERIEKLVSRTGLPNIIRRCSLSEILDAHLYDKKFIGRKNRFVLPIKIGKVKVIEDIPLKVIKDVLKKRTIS